MSRLLITTTNRSVLSLDGVRPGDTIASVKAKIQDMEGIPVNRQQLWVHDYQLEDTYKLTTFANFAELELVTFFDIQIRKLDGEALQLKVETNDFIWSVKCKIAKAWGIPPDQQQLVLDQTETVLHNDRALSHYSIQNTSILNLIRQSADGRLM